MRIGLAAAVTALGLSACGAPTDDEAGATTAQTGSSGLSEAVGKNAATRSRARVRPVRAIRIATAAVDRGRVFDLELDNERGRLV